MLSWIIYFVLFLPLINTWRVSTPAYTSENGISELIKEEIRMIRALERFIKAEEKQEEVIPDELKTLYNKCKTANEQIRNDTQYPESPINAFHFIYRLSLDWKKVFDLIVCDDCRESNARKDFQISIGIAEKYAGKWPTITEAEGSAMILLNLWDLYNADLSDVFDGKLPNSTAKPLSPTEILFIARTADDFTKHYQSIVWLTLLEKRMRTRFYKSQDLPEVRVAKSLASAYSKFEMPWKSLEVLDRFIKQDPENHKLKRDIDYYKIRMQDVSESDMARKLTKPDEDRPDTTKVFEDLCRGNIKSAAEMSRLRCFYRDTAMRFLRVKEEVLNTHPRISLIYDMITDSEIKVLENLVSNRYISHIWRRHNELKRKFSFLPVLRVFSFEQTNDIKENPDVKGWLLRSQHPILKRLDNRTRLVTRYVLNAEAKANQAETEEFTKRAILIQNHGFGQKPNTVGLPPQLRAFQTTSDITWMYQLNDVISGGSTVFEKARTRVPAIKGSAVYWYNIKRTGKPDSKAKHAHCPVLIGTKWNTYKGISAAGVEPLKCWKYFY